MAAKISFTSMVLVVGSFVSPTPGMAEQPNKQKIQDAIQKGSDYLVKVYEPGCTFPGGPQYQLGYACLAGLALLESGVDEKNASVQNIVKGVRSACLRDGSTYQLALSIMFLDRYGDPEDLPIIQFLGIRLLSGQRETGGWTYSCGGQLNPQDEARLRNAFKNGPKPRSDDVAPKGPKKVKPRDDLADEPANPKKDGDTPKRERAPLHPENGKLLNQMQGPIGTGGVPGAGGDNSNTQFAILGLWCARRHGVPIDNAMALLNKRFRSSQNADGTWLYNGTVNHVGSVSSMTCAGLIGLAASFANNELAPKKRPAKENRGELVEDPAVKSGFKALGRIIPAAQIPNFNAVNELRSNLYLLWSVERVGVIYGVEKFDNLDWYAWGSEYLVKAQTPAGTWTANFAGQAPEINAALGLLFLNRSNVAKDLTGILSGKTGSSDSSLRSGGLKTSPQKDPRNPMGSSSGPNTALTPSDSDFEKQASQLMEGVVNATGAQRTENIQKLRDAKGAVHTEALKRAVVKLAGAEQAEVREALAQRLKRMTAATLREMINDENREIRLAVATAWGLKADQQFVPDLISALIDKDSLVIDAVHTSLVSLTGKDFGPNSTANEADRTRSVLKWRSWWKTQKN